MGDLKNHAQYYRELGLHLFMASNMTSLANVNQNNILKSPFVDMRVYDYRNRKYGELDSYPWDVGTGLGVFLGINDVIAIDVDGFYNPEFINEVLHFLNLERNYPWVVCSGSGNGFHILLRCMGGLITTDICADKSVKLERLVDLPRFGAGETNAYYPHEGCDQFRKMEFKWLGHLMLPPSLHVTGGEYKFLGKRPHELPHYVDFDVLYSMKEHYCSYHATYSYIGDINSGFDNEIVTGFYPTKGDEDYYSYSRRRYEPYFVVDFVCRQIKERPTPFGLEEYLISLTWMVLDKKGNAVKRKTLNFTSHHGIDSDNFSSIEESIAGKLCSPKRGVLQELIFDLGHAEKVFMKSSEKLNFLKREITESGLYLNTPDLEKVDDSCVEFVNDLTYSAYLRNLKKYSVINSDTLTCCLACTLIEL